MASEKLNLPQRIQIYGRLKDLFSYDVKSSDALEVIIQRRRRKGLFKSKTPPLIRAALEWREGISAGRRLSQVMRGWVPVEICSLIDSGEKSGNMVATLDMCISLEKGRSQISGIVKQCITVPLTQLFNPLILILVSGFFVIPKFSEIIPPEDWVGPSRAMKAIFDVIISFEMLVFLFLLVFLGFLSFRSLSRWTGSFRTNVADNFFPWSFYKLLVGSTYLSSIGSLLHAGYTEPKALEELIKVNTGWYSWKLRKIYYYLGQGQNLSEAMISADPSFPSLDFNDDLAVLSRFGNFNSKMTQIATQSLEDSIKRLLELAEQLKKLSGAFAGMAFVLVVGGLATLSLSAQSSLASFSQ